MLYYDKQIEYYNIFKLNLKTVIKKISNKDKTLFNAT